MSFLHIGNEIVARVELHPYKTIRHNRCELLLRGGMTRCSFCESHRTVLRVLLSRHENSLTCSRRSHSCRTNYRHLSSPEKVKRLYDMRLQQKRAETQMARLKARLQKVITDKGVQTDESLHNDLKHYSGK